MIAQSNHAIADFSIKNNKLFNRWYEASNYIIVLEINNEDELQKLYSKLVSNGADVISFHEPDIDNQMTSVCFYGTPEMRKITQSLDLALKN
jgi:peptidyl-tRNA hydrolase